jgi:glycosyltransferase involved in cell wall biosynthesis
MRSADSRPLVSVVITTRNQANALAGAVRSATAAGARVQIVVVDDGSTDGTSSVARRLDVVFECQLSRGTAAARNRGLRVSTGEFVIFLDAADRLLAGAIDVGVRALTAHPGCAMAYGRALVAGPDGALWPTPEVPLVRSGHHAALLQTNLIWMSAMAIFRRDAVERAGGFAEDLDGAAEYDLYLRISRDTGVVDHGFDVAASCGDPRTADRHTVRLLRDTLEVMRRNCPDPHTPLHGAWREGYARWQEIYGTRLVDEIRGHLQDRALANAARKSATLVSLAPHVLVRELGRNGRAIFATRQRRTKITAGPSPSSKAPRSAMPNSVSRS